MKKFFKVALRIVVYILAFILPIAALAAVGFKSTVGLASKPANWAAIPEADGASLRTKSFDPTKPTVAIVLGNDQTEITDFLIPYELFSASEAYNVYAVAPERKLTTISVTSLDLMNILFHWDHPTDGVLLYDGVGELELASIFDTYAATYSTKLQSVSQTRGWIRTRDGLQIVPRWDFEDVPTIARLIVPGNQARQLATDQVSAWESKGNVAQAVFLHADNPDGFAFDAPLQDLAYQENISTAILDAKRLEYRPETLLTEGSDWPVWLTIRPLLLGLLSLAITVFMSKRWRDRSLPRVGGVTVPAQA